MSKHPKSSFVRAAQSAVNRSYPQGEPAPRLLSGEKLVRIRVKIDYDPDVPRCANCIARRKVNHSVAMCLAHNMTVRENGVCNEWRSHKGETLEDGKPKPSDPW